MTSYVRTWFGPAFLFFALIIPSAGFAQTATTTAVAAVPPQTGPDPDLELVPGEPEFTLATLPASLRMPAGKFAFRMTHRFARAIGSGTVGAFFADFFGFDSHANVGLQLRYGVASGMQVAVERTNDRTIQFLGQREFLKQAETQRFAVSGIAAIDAQDNFSEHFATTLGAIVSHRFGDLGAVYAEPFAVLNAGAHCEATDDHGHGHGVPVGCDADHRHAVVLGLGGRVRLGASRVYLVAEVAPRLGGYNPGVHHVSFGLERRAGGHMFQLNASNSLGTTLAQVARGGQTNDDWYIGFNLTRRFF